MYVQAYLFFEGRCDEALAFYKAALGAEIGSVMRYKQSPVPAEPGRLPPGSEEKIMHGSFKVGQTTIMASDGNCSGQTKFDGFALTLTADSDDEARRWFTALTDGGTIQMPLSKTFFASQFGMVTDRFGVMWMVIVET